MASTALTPPKVLAGPGFLYWAPVDSTEPTHVSAGGKFTDLITSPFISLGPTTDGTKFTFGSKSDNVMAAEFFGPIDVVTTEREGMVEFNLMNVTLANLKRVLNGGTITTTGTTGSEVNRYAPPAPGAEVRSMLIWESTLADVRLVCYQCRATSDLEMSFKKGADVATIPATFSLLEPLTGQPFNLLTAGTARA